MKPQDSVSAIVCDYGQDFNDSESALFAGGDMVTSPTAVSQTSNGEAVQEYQRTCKPTWARKAVGKTGKLLSVGRYPTIRRKSILYVVPSRFSLMTLCSRKLDDVLDQLSTFTGENTVASPTVMSPTVFIDRYFDFGQDAYVHVVVEDSQAEGVVENSQTKDVLHYSQDSVVAEVPQSKAATDEDTVADGQLKSPSISSSDFSNPRLSTEVPSLVETDEEYLSSPASVSRLSLPFSDIDLSNLWLNVRADSAVHSLHRCKSSPPQHIDISKCQEKSQGTQQLSPVQFAFPELNLSEPITVELDNFILEIPGMNYAEEKDGQKDCAAREEESDFLVNLPSTPANRRNRRTRARLSKVMQLDPDTGKTVSMIHLEMSVNDQPFEHHSTVPLPEDTKQPEEGEDTLILGPAPSKMKKLFMKNLSKAFNRQIRK